MDRRTAAGQRGVARYTERLRRHTRHLVRRHADKIERLAVALIERSLTAAEIDQVVQAA